jgi:hypothetical protein
MSTRFLSAPGANWRRALGPVLAVAIISTGLWVIGFDWPLSLAAAGPLVAVFALRRALGTGTDVAWRESVEGETMSGTRREVARLAWSMHGLDARVDRRSVERLHAVAAARLAEHGLDLMTADDEAACRRLLGDATFATLTAHPNHPPRYDSYEAAVGVVECLTGENPLR